MPVTYTNRKGVTYTLYQVQTVAGQTRYVVGRQSKGEPVEALPPGFRFNESPNGIVSLVRDRPSRLLPEEVAAVEAVVGRRPRPQDYRVVAKHNRVEVFVNVGPELVATYHEMVAAGHALPGREDHMRELEEQFAHFAPALRFVLIDPVRRTFRAEARISYWGVDEWVWLGQTGDADALAGAIVPSLSTAVFDDVDGVLAADAPPSGLPGAGMAVRRSSRRPRAQPSSVHRLKVTLMGSRPPIWRRLLVPSNITLAELHYVLQIAMGWDDSHLHQFKVGEAIYTDLRTLDGWEDDLDERTAVLARIIPTAKRRFRYEYDFGDSWEHEILVEAVQPPEAGMRYPVCIAGKRACPPEDCGGVWGYVHLLEALADPHNPEHAELLEWIGGSFDPEAFDLDAVNQQLANYN